MLPGIAGISGFGALKPTTVSYQTFSSSLTNLSAYTFSAQPFGTASADRVIVVVVGSESVSGTHTITSATIGGVSATINVQQSSGVLTAAIVSAVVPTGTTGNVVVNVSTTIEAMGIAIFSTTGLPSATAVASGSNTDLAALTLAVEAGGFVIAACVNDDNRDTTTWSGATLAVDGQFEERTFLSAASDIIVLPSVTVQPTLNGAASPTVFVAATF